MYQSHSDTSKNAYLHNQTKNKKQADKVLDAITDEGVKGISAGWLSQNMKIPNSTIGARVVELEERGLIVRLERTVKNPSGTAANVIIASAFKADALARGEVVLCPTRYAKKPSAAIAAPDDKDRQIKALKDRITRLESKLSQSHTLARDLGFKMPSSDARAHMVTKIYNLTLPLPPEV